MFRIWQGTNPVGTSGSSPDHWGLIHSKLIALEVIGHLKLPVGALYRAFEYRGTEAAPLVSNKLVAIRMTL
jgi:hypothetical protein